MEETFLDYMSHIFYETSKKNPEDEIFLVSTKTQYPSLSITSTPQAIIPLPRMQNGKYLFEGRMFENTENGRRNLWSLFLASVYHLAAHAAISEYHIYDKWRKNKTQEVCWRVIDFIEDVMVEKYLSTINSDALNNIKNINSGVIKEPKNNNAKLSANTKNNFFTLYLRDNRKSLDKIKDKILLKRNDTDHVEDVLACADILYNNRELLPQYTLPYCEHHNTLETIMHEKDNLNFQPQGLFAQDIMTLKELWNAEEENKARILKRYIRLSRDLNFDEIVIPSGDIHAYLQIKSQNTVLLRKIRDGIRTISNMQDDPRIREIGIINMQYAIQAVASESNTVEIFEQDEVRRVEEAWVILLDCSGSMKLKFNKMKEFALCVAETANELTGRNDAWSLHGFDSKFRIIKDFKESYSQEVKARVGALKSGGLSFVPDAIELGNRLLREDSRERKYLFVITDGQSSGDDKFEKKLQKIVRNIGISGVSIIGVGMNNNVKKFLSHSCDASNLRDMVTKFIKTYQDAASDT